MQKRRQAMPSGFLRKKTDPRVVLTQLATSFS